MTNRCRNRNKFFISYSRKDKDFVRRLNEALKSRHHV